MASACSGYCRPDKDIGPEASWSREAISRNDAFEPGKRLVVPWTRVLGTREWITEERSKSYVGALAAAEREQLLARVSGIAAERFPDGRMVVPYRTAIWIARRR